METSDMAVHGCAILKFVEWSQFEIKLYFFNNRPILIYIGPLTLSYEKYCL